MKAYLKSVAKQLQNYSESLSKTSLLIEKPWALIDDELELQKLIFKKNKELILSKNGQVQMGKWDYLPEARSLLIDRGSDVILCNEAFIDEGVMILKLDGTDNRFFVLANENLIPDLNAYQYIKQLRHQILNIQEIKMADGRKMEIQLCSDSVVPTIGDPVTIDALPIDDGKYKLIKSNRYFEIKNGLIKKILIETKYETPEGLELVVEQHNQNSVRYGDLVSINGLKAKDGLINFNKIKNLVIRKGKVVRVEYKNPFLKWLSKCVKEYFGTYKK